jgi:Tol biopolymer transport system component/cytosine/adenosine deaminase-related metal-dependent hydrolase
MLVRRRRDAAGAVLLTIAVGAAAATSVGPQSAAARSGSAHNAARQADASAVSVTLTEVTNLAASSGAKGPVVLDIHGALFTVPVTGGEATQIAPLEFDAAQPDLAEDGRIAVQSFADGGFDIWILDGKGDQRTKVTSGPFDDREPAWSPDGTRIAFSSDRSGSYDIWSVDLRNGELTRWTDSPGQEVEPAWSHDGTNVAFVEDNRIQITSRTGDPQVVVPRPAAPATLHSPSFSPSGNVAYVQRQESRSDLMVDGEAVTSGEDVFPFNPTWLGTDRLLYTSDGRVRTVSLGGERREVPFQATLALSAPRYQSKEHNFDDHAQRRVKGIVTPQLSPDGASVVFVALNDLWTMPIGGRPSRLTNDAYHEANPAYSWDGKQVAYSSDRAGTPDIYIRDLETGMEERATSLDTAEVSPSFSPDGSQLAFQDESGTTYLLELATGAIRELVSAVADPTRPSWSPDGETIAIAAPKRYSQRFREGVSHILTVDVATGTQRMHAPGGEHDTIATRFDDGPVWAPDGRSMAFVVDSQIKVMRVAKDGTPLALPRVINDDTADAPTWSGDSRQLLYLSNGRLRLADVQSGQARTVDVNLRYRPSIPAGKTVIHAGALWDGVSKDLLHNVDVTLTGSRIKAIAPHKTGSHVGRSVRYVDASNLTLMPGLTDAHVHQEYESRFIGDRQGRLNLAYGVTSTISMGDSAYRAIEDRESLQAGERVGPRFYASGELLDGARSYYGDIRSIKGTKHLDRELARAKALDYDHLKTYVRLPINQMKTVTDYAHEMGVPVSSHYMTGAMLGQDGSAHLTGTQRLGFARTQTATGNTYGDVPKIYGATESYVTTTLFTRAFVTRAELQADPRLVLFPPWQRNAMLTRAPVTTPPADHGCATAACRRAQAFKRIQDAGGRVLIGSDAPHDYVGVAIHANLRELVAYGWTPYDALRAATVNPARYLGVAQDAGTLQRGQVADMVAVRGNPLSDIDNAANVEMTAVGGRLYTIDKLLAPFVP